MASKVLVKIPVASFGHVNKGKPNSGEVPGNSVTAEIVTVGPGPSRCTDPLLRVAQLEQNIRFLQEQHQQMLSGLHQEIDSLRQKNRELQFQLVFSTGQIASSPTSSSEEESKDRILSPKEVNVTPLQVELLEREVGELKITLNDVNTKNAYLSAIIDEQKKKLDQPDRDTVSSGPDPELINKLDDVEALVRKLRRENDDLRREASDLRSGGQGQQHQNQHRGGRHHRGSNSHHYRGHNRFPPLHSQSYWQGGRSQDKDEGPSGGTSLPVLNMQSAPGHHQQSSNGGQHHGGHYSGGGKRSGNHHQYHQSGNGGGGGKYRGSQRGHKS